MSIITDSEINTLKIYFNSHKRIAFAFLFGSQAKGKAGRLSDVDIAVYFYPQKRHPVEYEEDKFYRGEDEIWDDMEQILNKDVDLLVLNRVSSSVAANAIRGIPLTINDWGLYLDFMEAVTGEAEDFMDFIINDYFQREAI